jgi:probable HAF family extracellular repeat protein
MSNQTSARQTILGLRARHRSQGRDRRELSPGLESLEGRSLLSYTITDLGTLGGPSSEAFGLNNNGQVVGGWQTGRAAADGVPITHGFIWDSAHGMRDLGALGGDQSSVAVAINDAGEVAGTSSSAPVKMRLPGGPRNIYYVVTDHAVTWGSTLKARELGDGSAYGINGAGEVVGTSGGHATLWIGGATTNLGTLGGPATPTIPAYAYGINPAGHLVGSADNSSEFENAFLWTPTTPNGTRGTMTNLSALSPSPVYGSSSSAINALDEVVGWTQGGTGIAGPVTATLETGGRIYNLGTLGGNDVESEALSLNAYGVVVGDSDDGYGFGSSHSLAWIWTPTSPNGTSGQMTDLNSLIPAGSGWVLNEARAVNDAGQIAGRGTINGIEHAFLLTPTTTTARPQASNGATSGTGASPSNPIPGASPSLQGLLAAGSFGVSTVDPMWWTPSSLVTEAEPMPGATYQAPDLALADPSGHPHRER